MAYAVVAYVQDSLIRLGWSPQDAVTVATLFVLMLIGVTGIGRGK
jgi:hypothetical protein